MLYEDVDFKTISDRFTKRRMLPFLTHIDRVRANLFSINPRQKMPPTIVNQDCLFFFFTVKLDPTNAFLSGRDSTYLSEINCCVFMKLKRQSATGMQTRTRIAGKITKPLLILMLFHKELMGHIIRKPVLVICEQQKRRSACASTQSDQRLCCCSLPGK